MKGNPRKRRRPAWLFRQLNQDRFIIRLFLISLLVMLCLGFAGALQSGLASIGAGQTELAYTVASLRNGASLNPIKKAARYSFVTTADASLQNYFSLDPETGELNLRDGLRSLSIQTNPLSSFPYQIIAQMPGGKTQVFNLYIHFMKCKDFLIHDNSSETVPTNQPPLSDADSILRCMQVNPVFEKASTLNNVTTWIKSQSKGLLESQHLLPTQESAYLSEAMDVFSPPQLSNGPSSRSPHALPVGSKLAQRADAKVTRLFVLQDSAIPGLRIFPVADDSLATPADSDPQTGSRTGARESVLGALLRLLDQIFLLILQVRFPVLISLGIMLPLLGWIIRQQDRVVRRCLGPYLLLLLAQVLTLFVADMVMGEGLVIWVGFFYTVLRLLQLTGLFWMGGGSDPSLRRVFDLRSRPWLLNLMRLELLLWSINALGLGWHIVGVFQTFPLISPA
jgi:hypothetical protein